MIQITNSLTGKREPFIPLKSGEVRMYVCGPTVYGLTHVGNARPAVFFDVVRRYLECIGHQVTYTSNFTDVDDKIIQRAREEKRSAPELALHYTREFLRDMTSLGVRPPDHAPRVTGHMPRIIFFIEQLVKKGAAYVTPDGGVFYCVRKFKSYGRLSGKNIDELVGFARVEPGEHKRDPLDFALWKPQKAPDEPAWESPWGSGRPGWHIECSAMAMESLGESFDIHGGGIDLLHPHHENEIAQSEAFTGKPFVKYWMHNNMVTIDAEKMSKSSGNIFLNRDFIKKYGAETLKFLLLSGHYRSPIEFSQRHIRDCQASLHRFYCTLEKCEKLREEGSATSRTGISPEKSGSSPEEKRVIEVTSAFEKRWREAMEEDFNTAKVVGYIFECVRVLNAYLDQKNFSPTAKTGEIVRQFLGQMKTIAAFLNLFGERSGDILEHLRTLILEERGITRDEIESQIHTRTQARQKRDFKAADAVRTQLLGRGVELRDGVSGTTWDVVFGEETQP